MCTARDTVRARCLSVVCLRLGNLILDSEKKLRVEAFKVEISILYYIYPGIVYY